MNKKALKIAAAFGAALLAAGVLFVYNAFCGNIFSAVYAQNCIEKHIENKFTDNNYEISNARYSFKTGGYNCQIVDPNSEDGSFSASYFGGEVYDNYEIRVIQKQNTLTRLDMGFKDDVSKILDIYISEPEFGYGTVIYGDSDIDTSMLSLDMTFDTKNMPLKTCIVISMCSNQQVSLNRIKEIMNNFKNMGYRIDYCKYFDGDGNCYESIPVDELIQFTGTTDLEKYKIKDEFK